MPENLRFQAEWDRPLYCLRFNKLINLASTYMEKARILGVSSEHASDWLHAAPISSLGLKLSDSNLRAVCALHLGSPLRQLHTCTCGVEVDPKGRHGLSCQNQMVRHPRHSRVNDIIKHALLSADISLRLETPGLSRKDRKRPDGMTLFPYKEGKSLVWDFTFVDTLAGSYLKHTSVRSGVAAEKAEKLRLSKYEGISKDYFMVAVAVETFGAWGPEGLKFVKTVGQKYKS